MNYLSFFICCSKKNNNESKKKLLQEKIQNYEINNSIISDTNNNECFICLEPYKNNTCLKIKCCNVVVHKNCFNEWCKTKNELLCPLCNIQMTNSI